MSCRYKALVAADIYRDGGSIEVRFACQNGSFETIWLRVDDTPAGIFVHSDLLVTSDVNGAEPRRLGKNSAEEEALLTALEEFLQRPKIDVPFVRRTEDPHYLEILEKLLRSIPERIPRH
jgi:hypothetical protein